MADFTPSTIEPANDGLKSSSFLPSSSTSHLLLPLVFAVFLLPICHVCPHHCCCLELVAGVSSSVRTVSPSPSFSRNLLVGQTPLRFSVMFCPVALTPKYTPSSHMHVSFTCGPSRPLFPKFSSANFLPCTFADFPKKRSDAIFPITVSLETSSAGSLRAQRSMANWSVSRQPSTFVQLRCESS